MDRRQVAKHPAHAKQHTRGNADEREPNGQGHCTRKTRHRACTLVNGSQVANDTAQATQHTERAQR